MPAALEVRGRLSRVALAATVLVSLVVLFAPADEVPSALPGVDKVVHVLLFATLAVTGRWAVGRTRALAVVLVAYAGVSEVLQAVTPLARSGSLADLFADGAGIALGLAAWSVLRRGAAPGSLGR